MAPVGSVPRPNQVVYSAFAAVRITTNTTTNVKTTEGMLHAVVINTKGASANLLTISVDGATIGIIDTTVVPGTFIYDVKFNTSLSITTATGTAADATIVYI